MLIVLLPRCKTGNVRNWFKYIHKVTFSFRSAESRAESMNLLVAEHNRLRGALEFSNVHLHNEIIEAGSLKGLMGIFSTLFLYFSLFYIAYKNELWVC